MRQKFTVSKNRSVFIETPLGVISIRKSDGDVVLDLPEGLVGHRSMERVVENLKWLTLYDGDKFAPKFNLLASKLVPEGHIVIVPQELFKVQ